MSTRWPKPGLNNTAEYQASGHVFVVPTGGGPIKVDLKFVANGITIFNDNADAQVTFFSADGIDKTINLEVAGHHRFDVKCIRYQMTSSGGNVGSVAELTNIPAAHFVYLAHGDLGTIS